MQNDYDDYEDYESPPFRWMSVGVLLLAVVGFFSLAWYAYYTGTKDTDSSEVATLEADKEPIKVAPEKPGGMEFPHQEKTIYDAPEAADTSVEHSALMKEPEQPVMPDNMPEKSQPTPETKVAAIIQKAVADNADESESEAGEAKKEAEKVDGPNVHTIDTKADIKEAKKAASKAADKAAANTKPKVVVKIEKLDKSAPAKTQPVVVAPQPSHVLKPLPDPFAKEEAAKAEVSKSETLSNQEDKKLEIAKPAPLKPVAEPSISSAADDTKPASKPEQKPEISVVEAEAKPETSTPVAQEKSDEQTIAKPAIKVQAIGEVGPHQLQMGAFRSEAEAEAHWRKLNKSSASVIGGHGYKIVRSDLGEKGIYYRLRMVGFGSAAEAKSLCEQLKTAKQSCFYATP